MAYERLKEKRITFDMTEEMFQRLEDFKSQTGRRITSEIMREALDKFLPKKRSKKESAK